MSGGTKESTQLGNNVLDEIIAHKRVEVTAREKSRPLEAP